MSTRIENVRQGDLDALIEALRTAQQAFIEVANAQVSGPGWYTRGVDGMYAQTRMWVRKGLDATSAALAEMRRLAEGEGK